MYEPCSRSLLKYIYEQLLNCFIKFLNRAAKSIEKSILHIVITPIPL